MCLVNPHYQQFQRHCAGCRCFTTTTVQPTLIPPYQPKHRKPGPAR